MTRTRYRVYERSAPHFLTCSVVGWLPLFQRPECADVVLDSLRFTQQHERLRLYAYVLMEDHLHLVASATDLVKELKNFKSFTARRLIDLLEAHGPRSVLRALESHKAPHKAESRYQVWQEGSHPQVIAGMGMMRQKVDYVHNNPVRRGYVEDPLHWRYSSARNYAGQEGLVPVTIDW